MGGGREVYGDVAGGGGSHCACGEGLGWAGGCGRCTTAVVGMGVEQALRDRSLWMGVGDGRRADRDRQRDWDGV